MADNGHAAEPCCHHSVLVGYVVVGMNEPDVFLADEPGQSPHCPKVWKRVSPSPMDGVQGCNDAFDANTSQFVNERPCRGQYDNGGIDFSIQVFQ